MIDLTVLMCLLYFSWASLWEKWSWWEREAMMSAYINKIIDEWRVTKMIRSSDHHNQLPAMGLLAGRAQLPVGLF